MQEIKMNGTVKWFDEIKGYGYIIGADEETYYFEKSSILVENEKYKTGDKVKFIPNFGEINYALKIERK